MVLVDGKKRVTTLFWMCRGSGGRDEVKWLDQLTSAIEVVDLGAGDDGFRKK